MNKLKNHQKIKKKKKKKKHEQIKTNHEQIGK